MDPDLAASLGVLPGTTGNVDPSSQAFSAGTFGQALGTGTGQQGISPTGLGGTMKGTLQAMWDWLNKPFTTPMSPVEISLLVGVVIVSILLWNLVLYHIRIAAESI